MTFIINIVRYDLLFSTPLTTNCSVGFDERNPRYITSNELTLGPSPGKTARSVMRGGVDPCGWRQK